MGSRAGRVAGMIPFSQMKWKFGDIQVAVNGGGTIWKSYFGMRHVGTQTHFSAFCNVLSFIWYFFMVINYRVSNDRRTLHTDNHRNILANRQIKKNTMALLVGPWRASGQAAPQ